MPRAVVDRRHALALVKGGKSVAEVARAYGVQPPAIYRALRKEGYECFRDRPKVARETLRLPAAREYRRPRARSPRNEDDDRLDALRIAPRDPCNRCGVRGDIGCGCVKAPIGWRAG